MWACLDDGDGHVDGGGDDGGNGDGDGDVEKLFMDQKVSSLQVSCGLALASRLQIILRTSLDIASLQVFMSLSLFDIGNANLVFLLLSVTSNLNIISLWDDGFIRKCCNDRKTLLWAYLSLSLSLLWVTSSLNIIRNCCHDRTALLWAFLQRGTGRTNLKKGFLKNDFHSL